MVFTAEGILGMDFMEYKCVVDIAKNWFSVKDDQPLFLVPLSQ